MEHIALFVVQQNQIDQSFSLQRYSILFSKHLLKFERNIFLKKLNTLK
jgi:hypothetical protein